MYSKPDLACMLGCLCCVELAEAQDRTMDSESKDLSQGHSFFPLLQEIEYIHLCFVYSSIFNGSHQAILKSVLLLTLFNM